MNINELINSDTIVVNLTSETKKRFLQDISKVAGEKYGIEPTQIEDVILERETLGSTGLGKGIAIPHGRIEEIKKPIGLLAKLKNPIDFDANDGELVDIIFLLLAPVSAGADHLNALAAVSSVLKESSNREAIRSANSVEEITEILGLE